MGSASSNKSSNSSVKSKNNRILSEDLISAPDENPEIRAASSATTWTLWGGKSGGNTDIFKDTSKPGASEVDNITKDTHKYSEINKTSESGWWRKSSISSLRTFAKNDSAEPEAKNATIPKKQSPGPQELGMLAEPRRRAWSFWNRKSAESDENPPAAEVIDTPSSTANALKPIINELITGVPDDAILYKKKSKDDTAGEQNLENKNEEQGHLLNILTPSFDILPKLTTMASIYSNVGEYGRKWHILSKDTLKPKSLHQRKAVTTLNALRSDAEKPVRVLLIGIHGFFPTRMIRPLIGEPTGTSTKFITEAEKAVIRWFRNQDTQVEISKIALEREGKVMDRVNFFFEVLTKWVDEINKADFIYFVAHSQGCPVSIILLARLIEAGVIRLDQVGQGSDERDVTKGIRKNKVVSILAMAGVNNGPFYGVDQTLFVRAYSTIENDSLRELFQFQNFQSVLARKFIQSLRIIIASNVKITFVGSINDQLVPLYSSTCLFAHHPNIFKATFIDKDSKTPDFITRIVGIANHLNNLGYDDHGIIKEISGSLAGTLTGGGHSKIYNEGHVYDLGIKFALETSNIPPDQPVVYKTYQVDELGSNPYHLPWCMRGLLYETGLHVGREQIVELFREFEEWDPETKLLKDVKYRLNGLRSKL
ncbi:LANO_0H12442g1_1 [Lachancea nothofagi CBS 11611]|uniref:LANO_0H12442g1_1 n=1 Tax=Lachancea nothofagi CBS 11611 TaxID=1266666 RepID=A0A1G4KM70_9SACH|nr:LANO_0H12442g1_1 [Lachancea nothofagi CBS 11611]